VSMHDTLFYIGVQATHARATGLNPCNVKSCPCSCTQMYPDHSMAHAGCHAIYVLHAGGWLMST
jgi:hypothetical protein